MSGMERLYKLAFNLKKCLPARSVNLPSLYFELLPESKQLAASESEEEEDSEDDHRPLVTFSVMSSSLLSYEGLLDLTV